MHEMIEISLDRTDIICLIKGSFVPYELMGDGIIKELGKFTGGFNDDWKWNHTFKDDFTNKDLFEVYLKLKENQWCSVSSIVNDGNIRV